MPIPATSNTRKKALLRGMAAVMVAALIGVFATVTAAASTTLSWSVFVHIEYPDGFVYERAFATGVSTSDLPSILAACGSAHIYSGSWLQYHCFPMLE